MTRNRSTAPDAPTGSPAVVDDPDQDSETVSFFNTTFSTHRASPLFVGRQGLSASRLAYLARRLRDTLVGDVVRGIQIGLEATDTAFGQVGPLRKVAIRRLSLRSILGEAAVPKQVEGSQGAENEALNERDTGLWIELSHENATYEALLLPGFSDSSGSTSPRTRRPWWAAPAGETQGSTGGDPDLFVRLPLLLLRMPQSLKAVLCDWISTTFDCHVSRLILGTKTLISVWERWIKTAGMPSTGPDFILTVAFHMSARLARGSGGADLDSELSETDVAAEPGLKTLDISIAPSELGSLLCAGMEDGATRGSTAARWEHDMRERRRLAGGNTDDGWGWRSSKDAPQHPFIERLARYLDHHLALNMFHPSVRVVRISCGSFVLAQSRLKIVKVGDVTADVARAAWIFVTQLGARVGGSEHHLA